jgi:hypothetical protein
MRYIRIRLIRKLSERLNGVDLSSHAVGDVFDLTEAAGALLIAAGWAVQVAPLPPPPGSPRRPKSL